MQKRHSHVSPTLDIMAKKIFSLPEVTAAFIRDILELDVADAQIVEGSQPYSMAYEEDDLFSTAVDVRAKLHDGTEVIIEIQIRRRMRQKMAKILCVCISKERKTCSQNIHECEADLQGLVGDVHYGMGGRKQVSLLPYEKVKEYFEQSEEDFRYGRFGENLLVEGINWNSIAEGNRFRCGDVLLEAVRIGAGGPASDAYKGEKVCTPMEPWFVFCQILEAGRLREGEIILQQR